MKTYERYFLHCELELRANRKQGEPLPLKTDDDTLDVLTVLQDALAAETAWLELGPHDRVRITTIEQHGEVIVLLLRRGDPKASGQTFESLTTGQLRPSGKTDDDLVAVSSHLFVHLKPLPGNMVRHKAILEEVPGIGRSYAQSLLTAILQRITYEYQPPKGDPKETFTRALLDGLRSEKLGGAGKQGRVEYIELVRAATADGLDVPSVEPREVRMRLRVTPEAVDLMGKVAQVKDWAFRNGWRNVKVRVHLPDGKTHVVELERDLAASDALYVRAVPVAVKTALEQCTDTINAELLDAAVTQFKGKWQ